MTMTCMNNVVQGFTKEILPPTMIFVGWWSISYALRKKSSLPSFRFGLDGPYCGHTLCPLGFLVMWLVSLRSPGPYHCGRVRSVWRFVGGVPCCPAVGLWKNWLPCHSINKKGIRSKFKYPYHNSSLFIGIVPIVYPAHSTWTPYTVMNS